MNNQIDGVVRDTYRYFYVDGLVELAIGFLFLIIGLVLLAWKNLDAGSWFGLLAVLALILFTMGGTILVKRAVGRVKEKVTYPRTGYVAYDRGEPQAGRWAVIGAALFLLLLLSFLPEQFGKMPFVVGGLLGFLLAYMGYRVSLKRFYLLGGITFLLGVAVTVWLEDELVGATLTFAGAGLALLASGGIVLLGYLQRHPPVEEE